MKRIILVILFLIISNTAAASSNASFCVSLEESNGLENMEPADITINGNPVMRILSGETKCTDLPPGTYMIAALSANPYDPFNPGLSAWNAKPAAVHLEPYKRTRLNIHPLLQGPGKAGLWVFEKRKANITGRIAWGIFLSAILIPLIMALLNEKFKNRLSLKWADSPDSPAVALSRRSIFALFLFALGFIPCYIMEGLRDYNLSWYPFLWIGPSFFFLFASAVTDHRQAKPADMDARLQ
jgi:hypothetical protein